MTSKVTALNVVPTKGDYVVNPKTGRPVKVGGSAWLKLVKEGVVQGLFKDPKQLCDIKNLDNDEVKEKQKEMKKKVPFNKDVVRGRGVHKDKLVVKEKPVSAKEASAFTQKVIAQVVKKNTDYLLSLPEDQMETELVRLTNQEMVRLNNKDGTPIYGQSKFKVKSKGPQEHKDEEYDEETDYSEESEEYIEE